jgi:catechol 2,3-dioxygenase-like lactoylglutathione lyase family enzyme
MERSSHITATRVAAKDAQGEQDAENRGRFAFHHSGEGSQYDRAKEFLTVRGITIFKEEDRQSGTFQGRSAYFHDPDRNVIEIMHLVRGPVSEKEQ